MRESTTYQAILDEGRVEGEIKGIQRMMLVLGGRRFGPADAATQSAIRQVTDVARLEQMSERLLAVSTWQELLATP